MIYVGDHMSKTYFRPLSLVFGRDARELIASGKARCFGRHGAFWLLPMLK